MRHDGLYLAFGGARHHIDLAGLTGGRAITVYGQNEVVRDLIDARRGAGAALFFDCEDVSVSGVDDRRPRLHARIAGKARTFTCDYLVGCDGFHGIVRPALAAGRLTAYDATPPFAWLGILAEAPPTSPELVYALHDRGFALFSMRTPHLTRLYLQVAPHESIDRWSDDRIWRELQTRLGTSDGWHPAEGRVLQKAITDMRSFVVEPMRLGRVFLAGDAAHIVPPVGAKGLNLAIADVRRLAQAIAETNRTGSEAALDEYSAGALRRTWRAQRFSWWMTLLLHKAEHATAFDHRRQLADLDYLVSSRAAMTSFAENYVGSALE
jgi:p-hydroxybenzoate 3-monooxygenase